MLSSKWRSPVLLGALVSVLALLAAACGAGRDEEASPSTTGERIKGGALAVATLEGDSLDPHFSSFQADISLQRMLWRGAYGLDRNNVALPAMAAELPEVSQDVTAYTIRLKPGLTWSDGDDLKAEDFVMGILRTCNPDVAGQYQYILSNVVGCDDYYYAYGSEEEPQQPAPEQLEALKNGVGATVIDDATYEITISSPQPTFTMILSLWVAFPVPVHLLSNPSDPWPAPGPDAPGKLAYNGPYLLTEYEPGDHATLAPNPNWAGEVKPTLDTLALRFVDDHAIADTAYRTGEVDFANVDLSQLSTVKADFEGEYFQALKPRTVGVQMQLQSPPLDSEDVRLALLRATDYSTMNDVVYQGGWVPTTSWIPEISGGQAPNAFSDIIGFEPEAAKQHLAAAGYPNGDGFPSLNFLIPDSADARAMAEFLQANLRKILNIQIEIEAVDIPTLMSRIGSGDFQLTLGGWNQDYPDPENWILGQFETGGGLNSYNCSLPEIDRRVEQARFNPNNEERLRLYREVNELIVTHVCGIGVGLHGADHYLIKPHVVGMRENITGQDAVIAGDWAAEYWGRSQ